MKKILFPIVGILYVGSAFAEGKFVNPYIGVNANFNTITYSPDMTALAARIGVDLPVFYMGVGLEGGIKLGRRNYIYNSGFSFAYDYVFNSSATIKNIYIDEVEMGFSDWNIGFDNYVRVSNEDSKRTDLILGVGIGQAHERISIKALGVSENKSQSDEIFVVKLGSSTQLSKNVDSYVVLRSFIPFDDGDIKYVVSFQLGIKLHF